MQWLICDDARRGVLVGTVKAKTRAEAKAKIRLPKVGPQFKPGLRKNKKLRANARICPMTAFRFDPKAIERRRRRSRVDRVKLLD